VKEPPLLRDAQFEAEAEAFSLRFVCEDCGLFDAVRGCAHGYPVARHDRAAQAAGVLVFCKDFDVG
jgi:hypothetical protein